MNTPGRITATAILQLISGAANLTVMWWVAGWVVAAGCGALTSVVSLGMCPIGLVCGFVPWLLIPLGIAEIVAGIMGLANPKAGGGFMRVVAILEMISVLLGGFGSFIAGAVGLGLMSDPEVKAFLTDRT